MLFGLPVGWSVGADGAERKHATNSGTIPIESFFDALTDTALEPNEIVTEIDAPTPPAGSTQTFTKFRQRQSIGLAIGSVATILTMNGTTCKTARIAREGVAPTPVRSTAAENAIVGKTLDSTAAGAAASAAVGSASPLQHNAYEVPILKTLIASAPTPSS